MGRRGRKWAVVVAVAGTLGRASTPVTGQTPPAGFEECPSIRGGALCGTILVPEDHDATESRTLGLRVKILSATGPRGPGSEPAHPVFFLAGGPGQAATELEPLVVGRFAARFPERDFVLVDQRGTGGSNPLSCSTSAPSDPTRLFGPAYTEDEIRACRRDLEKRADLTRYGTVDFARDLEAVRRALGYGPIDVVGGSYGTQAALVYMRAFPGSVRAAVLEGVAPPSFLNPLPAARGSQAALDALFRGCEAEEACSRRYPDLESRFETLLRRLEATPASVALRGTRDTATLDRDALAFLVHVLLFSTNSAVILPALIDQADRGLWDLVPQMYRQINESLVGGLYFGLQLSVTCTENEPFLSDRDLDRATRGTYLGRAMVDGIRDRCALWPRGTVPAGYHDPVRVDVPTLLISGALDPATPPAYAEQVAGWLPNVRHLVIPNGAHVTAHPCPDQLVVDFIRSGDAAGLDASCLEEIPRPPFHLPTVDVPRR